MNCNMQSKIHLSAATYSVQNSISDTLSVTLSRHLIPLGLLHAATHPSKHAVGHELLDSFPPLL